MAGHYGRILGLDGDGLSYTGRSWIIRWAIVLDKFEAER